MSLEPILIAGTASARLADRLAQELGCQVASRDVKAFPDGEVYVRIHDDVEGRPAIIVQSTHPNEKLVELLLLQDAAKEAGAARVVSVVPYYGYARQDRAFRAGEAVSSRAVARALATTADTIVTVDPHKEHILDFFFGGAHSVTAVPQIAAQLGSWGVDVVLAPDAGARDRAAAAARILDVPFDHLHKVRLGPTEVRMETKELDVAGKRVAIVDDLVASGGTMVTAAGHLKKQGATAVYAACTHGLFSPEAIQRMLGSGIDRLLCTDTVEVGGCASVSAARPVAEALAGLL